MGYDAVHENVEWSSASAIVRELTSRSAAPL